MAIVTQTVLPPRPWWTQIKQESNWNSQWGQHVKLGQSCKIYCLYLHWRRVTPFYQEKNSLWNIWAPSDPDLRNERVNGWMNEYLNPEFHLHKGSYLHIRTVCRCPARAFSWPVEVWTGQTPPSLCLRIKCGTMRFPNELNGWTETFFSGTFLTFVPVYRVELISPVGASGSARLLPGPLLCLGARSRDSVCSRSRLEQLPLYFVFLRFSFFCGLFGRH